MIAVNLIQLIRMIAIAAAIGSCVASTSAMAAGKHTRGRKLSSEEAQRAALAYVREYSSQLVSATFVEDRCTEMGAKVNELYFKRWPIHKIFTEEQREPMYRYYMMQTREVLDRLYFNFGHERFCEFYADMVKELYRDDAKQMPITMDLEH